MPKEPFFVHCGFCNQAFHTFDSSKKYCNHTCITKSKAIKSSTPWEEKEGLEGMEIEPHEKNIRCFHCGKRWREKKKGHQNSRNLYCDEICQSARRVYDKEKNNWKICPVCQKSFKPSKENSIQCGDACRYTRQRKRELKERTEKRLESNLPDSKS